MAIASNRVVARPVSADAVRVCDRLMACRATLMFLHGAHYAERVQPVVAEMRRVMAATGLSALPIVARAVDASDVDVLWLSAAAVEVVLSEEA